MWQPEKEGSGLRRGGVGGVGKGVLQAGTPALGVGGNRSVGSCRS